MATDLERLVVSLEANIRRFEREMGRSRQVTDRAMSDVERRTEQMTKRVEANFGGISAAAQAGLTRLAGIVGAALSVNEIRKYADSYTKIENSLKTTGLQGEQLSSTFDALFQAAQRQAAPIGSLVELYSRMSLSQKELNVSQPEMLRFTEGVALALRVQGTSAQEASGALLQLAQALGGGKVQAEEFNSLIDGAPVLLRAAAAGLKEANGSVAELTRLVKDGEVSSQAFFRAFLAGLPQIERQAESSATTTGQAFEKVQNAFTKLVGELDRATGVSAATSAALNGVAGALDRIAAAVPGALASLRKGIEAPQAVLNEATNELTGLRQALAEAQRTQNRVVGADLERRIRDAERVRDQVGEAAREANRAAGLGRTAQPMQGPPVPAAIPAPAVAPGAVSTKDYPVPGEKDKKGGGGGGGGDRVNELEREREAIERRTSALKAEQLTVGASVGETARAEAAWRLLEAAKKANVAVTPQLEADIQRVAAAHGEATQRLHDLERAHRDFQRTVQEFQSLGADTLKGFISDLRQGKSGAEALAGALERVADKLLDMALDGLFGGRGGSGGGPLGSLLSSLLGGGPVPGAGRARGGTVFPGHAYPVGESGPETFVPTTPGRIIPKGRLGGSTSVTHAPTYQITPANGVSPEQLAAVIDRNNQQFARNLPALLRTADQRRF